MKIDLSKWEKLGIKKSPFDSWLAAAYFNGKNALLKHYKKTGEDDKWCLYVDTGTDMDFFGEGKTPEEARDQAMEEIRKEMRLLEESRPDEEGIEDIITTLKRMLKEMEEW